MDGFCFVCLQFPTPVYGIFLSKAVSEIPTGRGIFPMPAAVCRQRWSFQAVELACPPGGNGSEMSQREDESSHGACGSTEPRRLLGRAEKINEGLCWLTCRGAPCWAEGTLVEDGEARTQ